MKYSLKIKESKTGQEYLSLIRSGSGPDSFLCDILNQPEQIHALKKAIENKEECHDINLSCIDRFFAKWIWRAKSIQKAGQIVIPKLSTVIIYLCSDKHENTFILLKTNDHLRNCEEFGGYTLSSTLESLKPWCEPVK